MRKTQSIVLLVLLILSIKSFSQDTSVKVSYTLKEGSDYYGYFSKGISLTGGWVATPNALAITYASRDFVIGGWNKTNGLWGGARFFINSDNGFIGIGTINPAKRLHIKSPDNYSQMIIEGGNSAGLHLKNKNSEIRPVICGSQKDFSIQFWKSDNDWKSTPFRILENGCVGIGKTPSNHKLDVNGTIRANEIIVSNPSTADFVFEKNYKLKSLAEVEKFITQNKHLPDVASAKQMKKNGVKQGEMNAKLLQKIEELTLYMIQLKNETTQLRKENKKLKYRIKKLEK